MITQCLYIATSYIDPQDAFKIKVMRINKCLLLIHKLRLVLIAGETAALSSKLTCGSVPEVVAGEGWECCP